MTYPVRNYSSTFIGSVKDFPKNFEDLLLIAGITGVVIALFAIFHSSNGRIQNPVLPLVHLLEGPAKNPAVRLRHFFPDQFETQNKELQFLREFVANVKNEDNPYVAADVSYAQNRIGQLLPLFQRLPLLERPPTDEELEHTRQIDVGTSMMLFSFFSRDQNLSQFQRNYIHFARTQIQLAQELKNLAQRIKPYSQRMNHLYSCLTRIKNLSTISTICGTNQSILRELAEAIETFGRQRELCWF